MEAEGGLRVGDSGKGVCSGHGHSREKQGGGMGPGGWQGRGRGQATVREGDKKGKNKTVVIEGTMRGATSISWVPGVRLPGGLKLWNHVN